MSETPAIKSEALAGFKSAAITFKNNSYEDFQLTPPGGNPVSLGTNGSYTSTQTGSFSVSRGSDTIILSSEFPQNKNVVLEMSKASGPAKIVIYNKTSEVISKTKDGVQPEDINPDEKFEGDEIGIYEVTQARSPILALDFSGAVGVFSEVTTPA